MMEMALNVSFLRSSSNNAPFVSLDTAAAECAGGRAHQHRQVRTITTTPASHPECRTATPPVSRCMAIAWPRGVRTVNWRTAARMRKRPLCSCGNLGRRLSAWRRLWTCARAASRWRGARQHPSPRSWVQQAEESRPGCRCLGNACGGATGRRRSEDRRRWRLNKLRRTHRARGQPHHAA